MNPAPSYGVLDPAGRLSWAIHPALFYSARVHPHSRAAGFSGRCWIKSPLTLTLSPKERGKISFDNTRDRVRGKILTNLINKISRNWTLVA